MSITASALLKGILPGIYSTGTKGTCWTCLTLLLILTLLKLGQLLFYKWKLDISWVFPWSHRKWLNQLKKKKKPLVFGLALSFIPACFCTQWSWLHTDGKDHSGIGYSTVGRNAVELRSRFLRLPPEPLLPVSRGSKNKFSLDLWL